MSSSNATTAWSQAVQQQKPVNKCSLDFILSSDKAITTPTCCPRSHGRPAARISNKTFAPIMAPPSGSSKIAKRRPLQNVSVSNGSVKVSGKAGIMLANGTVVKKGSKYCMVEGCTSRAKHARRCWRHGGSVKCKVPDCANRAKTKGVCWSHGGGTSARSAAAQLSPSPTVFAGPMAVASAAQWRAVLASLRAYRPPLHAALRGEAVHRTGPQPQRPLPQLYC
ncbi:hypothetical protein GQ600_15603 [Phytophthora cactorum]|nr:hypothetical protein GQ600_15603 [Phytophthora cactorum]